MSKLTPSQETRERLARGGFKLTEAGAAAARHQGKKSLIADIDKSLPKLSAADLMLVSILAGDLGVDFERAHAKTDVYWSAVKAYARWIEVKRAIYQQPDKTDSTIGRRYVHLRNINGELAKYDIAGGRIVEPAKE